MNLLIKVLLIWLFFISMLSSFEVSWEGKWQVNWRDGAYILSLNQEGSDVNGTFEPSHGILRGEIQDNTLKARTITALGVTNELIFTISEDKKSFFGNTKYGEWVTGIRVDDKRKSNTVEVDQYSPLKAFYSFLALGNAVRAGNYDLLVKAMNIIYFSEDQNKLKHSAKLALVSKLFDIIDETLVDKLDFFKENADESHMILLQQLGTDVRVPLTFIQDHVSEKWMIKLPDETSLEATLKALLTARGKYEIDGQSNLLLSTPRDTIRTFYEQYDRWEEGGKKYVISTLNLSEVDPAIHA